MKRTVGLISTMAPDDTWMPEVLERVAQRHETVKAILADMGFEVLDEGPLLREYDQMQSAAQSLRFRGIQALVIFVG
ncbi:MAG: hypothetical protein FWF12_12795, partial [Betaproteobacteria bacterium]|nr:hypothetical protein [Betaproteobacteria bacterium]